MAGLVPAIHVFLQAERKTRMAGTRAGHDEFVERPDLSCKGRLCHCPASQRQR
jgi:hypothetical protein